VWIFWASAIGFGLPERTASISHQEKGEIGFFSGERCRLRNRCYVVLRGRVCEDPFFTWSLSTHQQAVYTETGGSIDSRAISHVFGSQLEAEAFCIGAGLTSFPATK